MDLFFSSPLKAGDSCHPVMSFKCLEKIKIKAEGFVGLHPSF